MMLIFVKTVYVVVGQLSVIDVMAFTTESDGEASYANVEKVM